MFHEDLAVSAGFGGLMLVAEEGRRIAAALRGRRPRTSSSRITAA